MNGAAAFLQQAVTWAGTQGTALWNVVSAIVANRPEPARNVLVYTLVLIALAYTIPKIVKIASK